MGGCYQAAAAYLSFISSFFVLSNFQTLKNLLLLFVPLFFSFFRLSNVEALK